MRFLVSVLALLAFSVPWAAACVRSPLPPPPMCERFWNGDAVALVEVVAIHEQRHRRRVSLRILDVYRGDPPREMTISDPWTSCGVMFGRKGRYLAWLNQREGGGWRAYDKSVAAEDLAFAETMRTPPAVGRIYGTVDKPLEALLRPEEFLHPLPSRAGVLVAVAGDAGRFEADVAEDLAFDVPNLPPGKYVVKVTGLPAGLAVQEQEVTVHPGGCQELRLYSASSASVSGRIVGLGRQPRFARIHFNPAGGDSTKSGGLSALTDPESGAFKFEKVPPGAYVLGFQLNYAPTANVPYARRFYPDRANAENAAIIHVREGEQVDNIEFHVGAEVPRRNVRVQVRWANGTPARNAEAYLRARNSYGHLVGPQVPTNDEGQALLEGFVDTDYKVEANAVCRGPGATRDVRPKLIDASPAEAYVELTIPGPPCELVIDRIEPDGDVD